MEYSLSLIINEIKTHSEPYQKDCVAELQYGNINLILCIIYSRIVSKKSFITIKFTLRMSRYW